jgi:chemotaxis protein MotB
MMRIFTTRSASVLSLILAGLMLGGCNVTTRNTTERNALMRQNQELQAEVNRLRIALDAATAENLALQDQNSQLSTRQPQVIEVPAPMPAASANTAFDDIAGIDTFTTPGQVHIRVPGDVLFASGRVELRDSAQQTLREIAGVLQSEYGSSNIRVEGYTDTDPIQRSDWEDNLELSLQRAAAVHRYLQEQGIEGERMYAAGFGEWKPRDSRANSRRVEIVVLTSE